MKVLQVNGYQSPGRRFNGLALRPYLKQYDIESRFFTWVQDRVEEGVISLNQRPIRLINRAAQIGERLTATQSLFQLNGWILPHMKTFQQSDVVHYHIIHSGFMSLQSLPMLTARKPSLWTLHDPWAMTGHCIHPFACERWKIGCGSCPDLTTDAPIWMDTTALNFKLKNHAYKKSKLELVVASAWMERMVQQSPLLSQFPIHRIPFGLDLDYFTPGETDYAKRMIGVEPGRKVITFRNVSNDFKGQKYALEALMALESTQPICVITLNETGKAEMLRSKYQLIELGWTNQDLVMKLMYDATDIFLMPSLGESFGLMAVEAMAHAKPTVCFDTTALPEVTFAPDVSLAVPARDSQALANALQHLLDHPEERTARGVAARAKAEEHYDIRTQAARLAEIYQRLHADNNVAA